MKSSEAAFLKKLEALGSEQARIESSSPIPESLRPAAKILGEKPLPTLLIGSFVISVAISTWFFPWILKLFNQGVLTWILR